MLRVKRYNLCCIYLLCSVCKAHTAGAAGTWLRGAINAYRHMHHNNDE